MSQTAAPQAGPDEEALVESVTEPGPGVPVDLVDDPTPDTRQRILDVALDLFTEQGFDGTSLRQIAERLGVTKAALYYHFESKDDILMALHMRLHEFGKDALSQMGEEPVTLELWGELLDQIVDQMLGQRKIFLMHERNQAALEKLHRHDHVAEHEDIQNQFRRLLADDRVPLRDRVRMAASFGVVFSGLFLSGEAFASTPESEIGALLREV
ncbi:MAG TPA: TetR/AcrR family transcriptional regulator, partial [Acidimicrobiales bacterium]|nr:TetR/AcrR family transcriptional regulator [Acidimicrobiales bacterium]